MTPQGISRTWAWAILMGSIAYLTDAIWHYAKHPVGFGIFMGSAVATIAFTLLGDD